MLAIKLADLYFCLRMGVIMKKILIFLFFSLLAVALFSTELTYELNLVCKNDKNLTLQNVILKDNATELNFSYKNIEKSPKSIGVYPPESDKSIFLYNSDASKIYRIIDIKNIPKWWPTKKYVLKPNETLEFTLTYEFLEPTESISIVEGKGNFNSETSWNFINIPVNSYSFIDKKTIHILDKTDLTDEDKKFLEENKRFEYLNNFISYYKNQTPEMKSIYLSKWKSDTKAIYFVDYLLKKDYDAIIFKPDLQKAFQIITGYPKTETAKKLKKFIKPILLKNLHNEFKQIENEKSLEKCALFLKKYAGFEKIYSNLSDINDAKTLLKSLIAQKREELKNAKDPELYKEFFKKYGTQIFKNTIYADYQNLEKTLYNEAIIVNNPKLFEKFLEDFPNSQYRNEIHKRYFEYLKNNNVSLEELSKYVGKYPDSPYIQEIVKLLPQKTKSDSPKKQIEKKHFDSVQEKIENFKSIIKNGDILHYKEYVSIENPQTKKEEKYQIIYAAKVIMILKTKFQVKIIDASLDIENPPSYILDNFKDLRDIMIGAIDDKDITKFEEFKKF